MGGVGIEGFGGLEEGLFCGWRERFRLDWGLNLDGGREWVADLN